MIVSAAVHDDLIEQFLNRVEQHPDVESAFQKSGRKVHVILSKNDDGGVATPWSDWDDTELVDGRWHSDDFIVSRVGGGGHRPGSGYVRVIGISAYCDVCGDAPQSNDHGLCGSCKVQRGLLTGPAGSKAIIQAVHDDDSRGTITDPGQLFEATADDDGVLRADLEYGDDTREQVPLNGDAHSIVRWVDRGDD